MSRALLIALAAACQASEPAGSRSLPIVNGTVDADDPAVVMVELGFGACSGTVVSPRNVLTAAHCGYPSAIAFGPSESEVTHRIDVVDWGRHPEWDIAMATMAEPAPVPPIELNRAYLAGYLGQPVRLVGYGLTDESATDSGIKREGLATLQMINEEEMLTDYAASAPCYGDSGGPQLMVTEGAERVAGVTSHGFRFECGTGLGAAVRVDRAIDWIDGYVVAHEPSDPPAVEITSPGDDASVLPGFAVTIEASDDHGIALAELYVDGAINDADPEAPYQLNALATLDRGPHEVEARVYDAAEQEARAAIRVVQAPACAADAECAQGEVCHDGRCQATLGEACDLHAECASGLCGVMDGLGHCTLRCDPAGSGECPSGFTCAEPELPGASGQCVSGSGPPSGCSAAPGARGGAWILILALLLGRSLRRLDHQRHRA